MRPAFSSDAEDRVSRYFARFVDRSGSQLGHVLQHPFATASLLRMIRALPALDMRLSDDSQGRAIRAQLDRAWLRRHALGGATAVLGLPESAGDYVRGSSDSKYTLRKRSRTASELGVRVELVDSPEHRRQLCAIASTYEQVNPREAYRNPEADNRDMLEHRFWFVASLDGRPIALAVLPADGVWAALRYFRTLEASNEATLSRYLMMEKIVTELVARGVLHIVVGLGPHRLGNGVRQFQRMMGFRIVRLRVSGAASVTAGAVPAAAGWRLQSAGRSLNTPGA